MKFEDFIQPEIDEIVAKANFTEEEKEIFLLLCKGKTVVSISGKLTMSERTAYRIIEKIKKKVRKVGAFMLIQNGKEVEPEKVELPKNIVDMIMSIIDNK